MRAHAVHLVKHAVGLAVQVAFDAKRGELVGHHAQVPSRGIAPVVAGTVRQNLGRRLLFVPGTERAEASALDLDALAGEVARAPRAVSGNDDPASRNGIFSQLRHRIILQPSESNGPLSSCGTHL